MGKPMGHQLMEETSAGVVLVPQLFPSLPWGLQAGREEGAEDLPQGADLGVGTSLTKAEETSPTKGGRKDVERS